MNRLKRGFGSLGTGVALGVAAYFGGNKTDAISAAEHNMRVEACADSLGDMAISTIVLPEPCQVLKNTFDKKIVSGYIVKANGGGEEIIEEEAYYQLPPADEFRAEELITPAEAAARNRAAERGHQAWAVAWGVGGIGVGYFILNELHKAKTIDAEAQPAMPNSAERV